MAYSAQNDKGDNKQQAPLWAMIAAGVSLLGLMGWWGYRNFGPQDPPLTKQNIEVNALLTELANKCQGDFGKLSPEDQAKATKIGGPYAPMIISSSYKK